MTKNEIINYVTETPHNVNKNILGQKLDAFQKNVSWNDLKDKPFYYTKTERVLLERQSLEFKRQDGETRVFVPSFGDIPAGATITVYWDGEEVECAVGGSNDPLRRRIATGDFIISWYLNEELTSITAFQSGTKVVGVTYIDETMQQVPPMVIPNSAWAEEEDFILFENATGTDLGDPLCENLSFVLADGDDVTIIYNGKQYTFNAISRASWDFYNDVDHFWRFTAEDVTIAIKENWDLENDKPFPDGHVVYYDDGYGAGGTTSIIVTRTTVRTNCELMLKVVATPNGVSTKLLKGDCTTAARKIKLGLPVYCCVNYYLDQGEGITYFEAMITPVQASFNGTVDELGLYVGGGFCIIKHDNSVRIE